MKSAINGREQQRSVSHRTGNRIRPCKKTHKNRRKKHTVCALSGATKRSFTTPVIFGTLNKHAVSSFLPRQRLVNTIFAMRNYPPLSSVRPLFVAYL